MIEILDSVIRMSPVFAVLVAAIYYFYKKEGDMDKAMRKERDKCHQEISDLNKEMREGEKENLLIISKLSDVIDRLFDDNKDQHELIKQALKDEMRDIRELIKEKINELKN
jgi:predicted CopG family antitoxin